MSKRRRKRHPVPPPPCSQCGDVRCEQRRRRLLNALNPGVLQRNHVLAQGGTIAEARQDLFARIPALSGDLPPDAVWPTIMKGREANGAGTLDGDDWPVFAFDAQIAREQGGAFRWWITENYNRGAEDNPGGSAADCSLAAATLMSALAQRHPSSVVAGIEIFFDAPEGVYDLEALNARFRAMVERAAGGYSWRVWKRDVHDGFPVEVDCWSAAAAAMRYVADVWPWAIPDYWKVEFE